MINYLLLCFASSLCVLTLYTLFNDDTSIFGKFPYYVEKTPLKIIRKPLYECLVCMSSVWGGSFFFVLAQIFSFDINLIKVLFAVLIIAGMNILFSVIFSVAELLKTWTGKGL